IPLWEKNHNPASQCQSHNESCVDACDKRRPGERINIDVGSPTYRLPRLISTCEPGNGGYNNQEKNREGNPQPNRQDIECQESFCKSSLIDYANGNTLGQGNLSGDPTPPGRHEPVFRTGTYT